MKFEKFLIITEESTLKKIGINIFYPSRLRIFRRDFSRPVVRHMSRRRVLKLLNRYLYWILYEKLDRNKRTPCLMFCIILSVRRRKSRWNNNIITVYAGGTRRRKVCFSRARFLIIIFLWQSFPRVNTDCRGRERSARAPVAMHAPAVYFSRATASGLPTRSIYTEIYTIYT